VWNGVKRVPEKDQYINLALRNQRPYLLIAAHRAAKQGIHVKTCFTVNQIAGGPGRGKGMVLQQGFMALHPVEQHLFAVIVGDQRNVFTFRE